LNLTAISQSKNLANSRFNSRTHTSLQDKPVISLKEARKALGRRYIDLSDDQVQEIVNTLTLIARKTINI